MLKILLLIEKYRSFASYKNAIKAQSVMARDVDYVVKDNQIINYR